MLSVHFHAKSADSLKGHEGFLLVFGLHSRPEGPRLPQVPWGHGGEGGRGWPWWIRGRRKPFVFTEIKGFEVASWAAISHTSWFCSPRGWRKVAPRPEELIDSFWWDRMCVLRIHGTPRPPWLNLRVVLIRILNRGNFKELIHYKWWFIQIKIEEVWIRFIPWHFRVLLEHNYSVWFGWYCTFYWERTRISELIAKHYQIYTKGIQTGWKKKTMTAINSCPIETQ